VTQIGSGRERHAVAIDGAADAVVLSWGAATDVGSRRRLNEDSLVAVASVFAVADGLGGHAAGDQASAAVVLRLADAATGGIVAVEEIEDALVRAAADIAEVVDENRVGVGTTVAGAALTVQDGQPFWAVFNVGDSRVYLFEDDELGQVTVDHSVVQELVDAGLITASAAETHPDSNMITRAIGFEGADSPDFWMVPVQAGMRLLLCSDGLTKEVGHAQMQRELARGSSPQETADSLVSAALAAGGRDNVTVVVVDVVEQR